MLIISFIIEGDHIKVTASRYPFPTVCKEDQATDWFNSLQNCLHWNKRERQKSFAVVESHPVRSNSSNHGKNLSSASRTNSSQQLSQSPRTTGFNPLSRSGTQSPPAPSSLQFTTHQQQSPPHHNNNNNRKPSSSSSVTSSSSADMQDEVFGMFYDDDSGRDRYRLGGSGNAGSRRRSSCVEAESSSESSVNYESTDEFESEDDEDEYAPDGFTGWTDEEIMKSRYLANITKELEKVSVKYTKHETMDGQ